MKEIIKRACAALGVDPARVIDSQEYDEPGRVVMVVDRGIKGSPKLEILLSDIPDPKPEPAKAAPKPRKSRTKKAS